MDLTTAKTRELVEEIQRRLPGGKRDAWGLVLRFKTPEVEFLMGNHSYVAGSEMGRYDDLDPQPEPRSLAERARAAMTENDLGGTTLMADELRAFVVATGEAVDALKAQVKFIRDREPWLPDVWRPEVSGPDLLEAAKAMVEIHQRETRGFVHEMAVLEGIDGLQRAVAAEEARRKA